MILAELSILGEREPIICPLSGSPSASRCVLDWSATRRASGTTFAVGGSCATCGPTRSESPKPARSFWWSRNFRYVSGQSICRNLSAALLPPRSLSRNNHQPRQGCNFQMRCGLLRPQSSPIQAPNRRVCCHKQVAGNAQRFTLRSVPRDLNTESNEGDPFGGPVAMRLGVGGSWSTVERTPLG